MTASIAGGSEGEKDNGEATRSQQGQVASAQAASRGEQTNVSASAGAQANDAMGDGNVGHPTQEILKQSETSAAALMAAYSTFGDKALPFVPFSPLFDLCL